MERLAVRPGRPVAGSGDAPPPVADPPPSGTGRRWFRPVAFALVGAIVAVTAYALIDSSGSDSTSATRAAAPSTSTTAAPAFAALVYKAIAPSLVYIETVGSGGDSGSAIGSGVVIDKAGQIMTAYHVVEGASTVKVTFADGTEASAAVVSSTPAERHRGVGADEPTGVDRAGRPRGRCAGR